MLTLLYLTTLVIFVAICLGLALRRGMLYYPVYFYLYLTVFHIIIPLPFIMAPDDVGYLINRSFLLPLLTQQYFLISLVLVITAAISFPLGWKLGAALPLPVFNNKGISYDDIYEGQTALLTTWFLFLLGAICFFLYFQAFGGVFRAFEFARAIRAGNYEINNPFSFLRPIGDFTKVANVMFIAIWLGGSRGKSALAGIALSTGFSFLMILFQGGRLSLALHIALITILFISNGYLSIKKAAVLGVMLASVLFFGYQIIFGIYYIFTGVEITPPNSMNEYSFIEFFVIEMSFPMLGLAAALEYVHSGVVSLRYGVEVIYGIMSIIPSKLVNFNFERITAIHTDLTNPFGSGTIPVDLMIYGVYSFYIIGPAICAFFAAFGVQITFRYISRIPWKRIRFALTLYFLLVFVRYTVYFDPSMSINSMYFVILCSISVYFTSRRGLR